MITTSNRIRIVFFCVFVVLLAVLLAGCKTENKDELKSNAENDTANTVPDTVLAAAGEVNIDTAASTEPETTTPETTVAQTSEDETHPVSVPSADTSVYSGSLFIGDSRTVGLHQYADLGASDVFATTGLNVFRLKSESVNVDGIGNVTVDQLLQMKKYRKIYIMLGINEIGYDHSVVLKKYKEVLDHLRELSPETKFILCANLHIVQKRSQSDSVYNNDGINELNNGIKGFADGSSIFYVDANTLFDDENGALRTEYAVDDFHLTGKYYEQWGRWLAYQTSNI